MHAAHECQEGLPVAEAAAVGQSQSMKSSMHCGATLADRNYQSQYAHVPQSNRLLVHLVCENTGN